VWYSASIIFFFEYKDGKQDDYVVWENTYLLQANSDEEARKKADEYGRQYEGDSNGTLTLEGRPVIQKYGGIRKLMEATNSINIEQNALEGAEITYSEFVVEDRKTLDDLISGKTVKLFYQE